VNQLIKESLKCYENINPYIINKSPLLLEISQKLNQALTLIKTSQKKSEIESFKVD
jgi:hypothetical protein